MINNTIISAQYIIDNSAIYPDVDVKILNMAIFTTQIDQLQDLLPVDLYSALFNELEVYSQVKELDPLAKPEDHMSERMINLIKQLKTFMLYHSLGNAANDLYSRITEKGVNTQTSDFSDTISEYGLNSRKKDWHNIAEKLGLKVIKYLLDNDELYPEYDDIDVIEESSTFRSSIYFGSELSN